MTHVPDNWRQTRIVLLRHDLAGDVGDSYNELMEQGTAYGHQSMTARIGEHAKVIDVRLTPEADIMILYEPWSAQP